MKSIRTFAFINLSTINLLTIILLTAMPAMAVLPVSFARPVPYTFSDGVGSFVVGDVNGDDKLDLITGGTNGVSVSLGNGDGTFSESSQLSERGRRLGACRHEW